MSRRTTRGAYAVPLMIALVSIVGLVSALVGDGVRDWISWIALAVPVAVVVWARMARRS